jgi:hypothetical protein
VSTKNIPANPSHIRLKKKCFDANIEPLPGQTHACSREANRGMGSLYMIWCAQGVLKQKIRMGNER